MRMLMALVALSGLVAACGGAPARAVAGDTPSVKDALGDKCGGARAQEAPDLMGWDPAARANLDRLRQAGIVAVRYKKTGCDVELELLPNCRAPGSYRYSAYSARETKIVRDEGELYASLPIGAAGLRGRVTRGQTLRTDFTLVGTDALRADTRVNRAALRGPDCPRATHVVTTVYLGGFALVAGSRAELEGGASVFGVSAGGRSSASTESLAREGEPSACDEAQASGKESPRCNVPLRIGLVALDGAPSTGSGDAAPVEATATKTCPEGMAAIAAGAVEQGSRRVDVGAFCIDRTEVRASDYEACVAKGHCRSLADVPLGSKKLKERCNYRKPGAESHPINCLEVDDAKRYCQSRGLLLPSEHEFALAARGREGRAYPWGEDADLERACAKRDATCAAGSNPRGATPEGVLDLAGNVAELVETQSGYVSAGGDYADDARGVLGRARSMATAPSPKIGFRCISR